MSGMHTIRVKTESAGERSATEPAARPGITLAVVAVIQFMVSLDLSVVNVGLPRIAAGLGFSAAGVTWVIHAYALTFGGLLLLGGKAADRYGRKAALIGSNLWFGAFTLAAAYATNLEQMFWLRLLAGLGIGGVIPNVVAVNADSMATWVLPALAPLAGDFCFDLHREDQEHTSALLRAGTVMAPTTEVLKEWLCKIQCGLPLF